jgi:hypothetical protein
MKKDCSYCVGIGWVCEKHPHKAWHDELGCMCSAGMPCLCNQEGDENELDFTEIIFVTVH